MGKAVGYFRLPNFYFGATNGSQAVNLFHTRLQTRYMFTVQFILAVVCVWGGFCRKRTNVPFDAQRSSPCIVFSGKTLFSSLQKAVHIAAAGIVRARARESVHAIQKQVTGPFLIV